MNRSLRLAIPFAALTILLGAVCVVGSLTEGDRPARPTDFRPKVAIAAAPAARAAQEAVIATVDGGTWQEVSPKGVSKDFNNPPDNYGFQIVAVDPKSPSTVYVTTNYQGLWRSLDSGVNWMRIDQAWKPGCGSFSEGRMWAFAIDPVNTSVMYSVNGYGCGIGLLKSTDGGVRWNQVLPSNSPTFDVNRIAIDPLMAGHLLVSFHSNHNCPQECDTPIAESFDSGATWRFTAPVPGGGWGQWVFFLNDSSSWLVAAQDRGLFRTTDSGRTWTKVSSSPPQHGQAEMLRAANGVWLLGSNEGLMKSTDNGASWTLAWKTGVADGVYAVGGDGTNLYTRSSNTGRASTGPLPYMKSSDGGTTWAPTSGPSFANGPMSMAYDAANGYLYSSNWNAGLFRLSLKDASNSPARPSP